MIRHPFCWKIHCKDWKTDYGTDDIWEQSQQLLQRPLCFFSSFFSLKPDPTFVNRASVLVQYFLLCRQTTCWQVNGLRPVACVVIKDLNTSPEWDRCRVCGVRGWWRFSCSKTANCHVPSASVSVHFRSLVLIVPSLSCPDCKDSPLCPEEVPRVANQPTASSHTAPGYFWRALRRS